MNNAILPNDYRETLSLIIQKIQLAQQKAVIFTNMTLLDLYWEIGNVILDKKKEKRMGSKSNRKFIKRYNICISRSKRVFK